jgi:hypothetical protein
LLDAAASRSDSTRAEDTEAARVSILPRPIMRVAMAEPPAKATIPMPSTTMAISTSTSVSPELERITITLLTRVEGEVN